jgi:soluble lytic murein transglycosylase-like protein
LAAAVLAALAFPAAAQVLEIADDGSVERYDGPAVFTDDGVEALVRTVLAVPDGDVHAALAEAAKREGLEPALLEAVAWQESRFRNTALSPKGAMGIMQLMPGTARDLGVDARDLGQNIAGGAAYLAQMLRRFDGDRVLALAAYNAGPGAVEKHGGIPPFSETRRYVSSILARLDSVKGAE